MSLKKITNGNSNNIKADHKSQGSDSSQASKSQSLNSKIFESLKAKSDQMREASVEKQLAQNSANKNYTEFNDKSINSNDESVAESQKSIEASSNSYMLKAESRALKERAKYSPPAIAESLKIRAKDKADESMLEKYKSMTADNRSVEKGAESQDFSIKAQNAEYEAVSSESDSSDSLNQSNDFNKKSKSGSSTLASSAETFSAGGGASTSSAETFSAGGSGASTSSAETFSAGGGASTSSAGTFSAGGGGSSAGTFSAGGGSSSAGTFSAGGGGSSGSDFSGGGAGDPGSSGSPYLDAARSLLMAIGQVTANARGNNPITQISKNLTNVSLADQAVAYLEAGMVDTALQGTPVNQAIILTKAQATSVRGESQTNVNFWKQVLEDNKQAGKQTHDLAKSA